MQIVSIPERVLEALVKYAKAAFSDGDLSRAYSSFHFTVENKVKFIVTESFVDHGDIPF